MSIFFIGGNIFLGSVVLDVDDFGEILFCSLKYYLKANSFQLKP